MTSFCIHCTNAQFRRFLRRFLGDLVRRFKKVDGLKLLADVMGNDCYKWYDSVKVLTKVGTKGVSKGENSAV